MAEQQRLPLVVTTETIAGYRIARTLAAEATSIGFAENDSELAAIERRAGGLE
jgi:hypothetical protein